jgi:thymidylate synthase (FAD)
VIETTSEILVRRVDGMGGDAMIVGAMLVSKDPEEALRVVQDGEASYGRINYLMKHRHGTPFEHSAVTFFVDAPIFVWREWHRHRIGMSYNEESGRYSELRPKFWVPRAERKMIAGPDFSPARPKLQPADSNIHNGVCHQMTQVYRQAWWHYKSMLRQGIAKEVARAVLPVATYSRCWVTCNPRSLMHFLSLRTHEPDAMFVSYPQAEIEEAARACEAIFKEGWPLTQRAFCENGRVGP